MELIQDRATSLTADEVIARTRKVVPRLRDRIVETEQLGRLPDATMDDAFNAGIFSLVLPVSLGGSGAGLHELVEVLRVLGRADVSVAWTIGFLTTHNWMLARYPKEAQDDFFAARGPQLMAGVANPPGRAEAVDGGYLVSGYWGYCSGVMHASWVQVVATIEGRDRPSLFVLPVGEVDVQDTWHMSGMKGTGSHDVKLDGRFVPENRTVDIDLWHSKFSQGATLHPEPIYSYDARDVLQFLVPAMALGGVEAMLELYRARLEHRRAAFSPTLTGDTVAGQARYARAVAALRGAEAILQSVLTRTVEANEQLSPDEELSDEVRAEMKLDCLEVCDLARESVETQLRGSGSGIYRASDVTQHFARDLQTLFSHLTVDEDGMLSQAGAILLGRGGHDAARNFT